jgi:hypothetical protein
MLASLDLNIYVLLITALVRGNGRYSNYASAANPDLVVKYPSSVLDWTRLRFDTAVLINYAVGIGSKHKSNIFFLRK